MQNYQNLSNCIKQCFILIIIGNIFIFLIPNSYFPDYNSIENALNDKDPKSLKYTLQYLILFIKNIIQSSLINTSNVGLTEVISLNTFSRQIFFLINILFVLILPLLDLFLNKKKNYIIFKNQNFIYFTSLLYPSVLLSITASSAESIYSIISIFLISRLIDYEFRISNFIFYFTLFVYAFLLDKGNWLIFLSFLIFSASIFFIKNKLDDLKLFILILLLIIIARTYSNTVIEYSGILFNIPNNLQTIEAINLLGLNDLTFLEVFKRYFYYWGTLLGIVTHHKNIVFSLLPFTLLLIMILRKKNYNLNFIINFNRIDIKVIIYSIFFFPIIIITILPTHAFAKYYLFFIPIILNLLLKFTDKKKFIFNIIVISLISISHQFIFFI